MPDTAIFEEDLTEAQFPWAEVEEMDAHDEGFRGSCCNCIPCLRGGCDQ